MPVNSDRLSFPRAPKGWVGMEKGDLLEGGSDDDNTPTLKAKNSFAIADEVLKCSFLSKWAF